VRTRAFRPVRQLLASADSLRVNVKVPLIGQPYTIGEPFEQVLWWEAEETSPGAGWNDGSSYPWENVLSRRHGRGACVGYFDGSVAWMDRLDYVAELQRPGPNRLYCDPHRADGGKSARGPNGQ